MLRKDNIKISKMSKSYAYVKGPFSLIYVNNKKIGHALTFEAKKECKKDTLYPGPCGNPIIYSVEVRGEIIWVSDKEFKQNNLKEVTIKKDR
jgi:hypothetical protein